MPSTAESTALDFALWAPPAYAYADWIVSCDSGAARLWARRRNSADEANVDGAVTEAVAWDFLTNRVDEIEPGPIPTTCNSAGNRSPSSLGHL